MDAAVKLSQRDCFLDRGTFMRVLSPAAQVLGSSLPMDLALDLPPPALLKPQALYTGKQLFTMMVALLVQHTVTPACPAAAEAAEEEEAPSSSKTSKSPKKQSKAQASSGARRRPRQEAAFAAHHGLSYLGKSKTPDWAYGGELTLEHKPLWRKGYFCRGILDKAAIGAANSGLVHGVFEVCTCRGGITAVEPSLPYAVLHGVARCCTARRLITRAPGLAVFSPSL